MLRSVGSSFVAGFGMQLEIRQQNADLRHAGGVLLAIGMDHRQPRGCSDRARRRRSARWSCRTSRAAPRRSLRSSPELRIDGRVVAERVNSSTFSGLRVATALNKATKSIAIAPIKHQIFLAPVPSPAHRPALAVLVVYLENLRLRFPGSVGSPRMKRWSMACSPLERPGSAHPTCRCAGGDAPSTEFHHVRLLRLERPVLLVHGEPRPCPGSSTLPSSSTAKLVQTSPPSP